MLSIQAFSGISAIVAYELQKDQCEDSKILT